MNEQDLAQFQEWQHAIAELDGASLTTLPALWPMLPPLLGALRATRQRALAVLWQEKLACDRTQFIEDWRALSCEQQHQLLSLLHVNRYQVIRVCALPDAQ